MLTQHTVPKGSSPLRFPDAAKARKLLLDLANLRDDGFDWFRQQWAAFFRPTPDTELRGLRHQLRTTIWSPDVSDSEKKALLERWLTASRGGGLSGIIQRQWSVNLRLRRILPQSGNLRAILVLAILDNFPRLGVCHNPECLYPYFFKRRCDQKFCERGDCTRYAQRQYALKSWHEKGAERRRQRRAAQRSKRKRKGGNIGKR